MIDWFTFRHPEQAVPMPGDADPLQGPVNGEGGPAKYLHYRDGQQKGGLPKGM